MGDDLIDLPAMQRVGFSASVPEALHKALDYCEENNLAGVVVCGSLYLAAEARPLMLKEAEN